MRERGFSVEERGDSLYVSAGDRDVVLADLPRGFLEEALRSGFGEIVLVVDKRYYYYGRRDIEKLLEIVAEKGSKEDEA